MAAALTVDELRAVVALALPEGLLCWQGVANCMCRTGYRWWPTSVAPPTRLRLTARKESTLARLTVGHAWPIVSLTGATNPERRTTP